MFLRNLFYKGTLIYLEYVQCYLLNLPLLFTVHIGPDCSITVCYSLDITCYFAVRMESNLRNINMLLVMDVKNKVQIEEGHNFIYFF